MKILIIKLGAIGDVIRTTAILAGIKEKFHDSMVYWVTKRESLDLLKNNGLIKEIITIGDANELKNNSFDLIISLDDDHDACKLASELSSKKIIGAYLENEKEVYTEDSSLWFGMGLISKFGKKKADELKAKNKKTYQEIMYKILGLKYKKQEPILILNRKYLDFGKNFAKKKYIDGNDFVMGINTGAGGRWQDKKLSIEETAELIDKLNNKLGNENTRKSKIFGVLKIEDFHDIKILLFGGPEEAERNKRIISLAKAKIIDAGCNNSLMEFASLVNLCNVLVTSDSLALHIGTALKKKVVVFFYPTSASEIELYRRGIKIIGKGKSYCSYQSKCDDPPKWDIDGIVSAVKKLKS